MGLGSSTPPSPWRGRGRGWPCWTVLLPNSALKWLKQTFDEADKNGDGSLSIGEVLQLLHKLNVNLPRQKVKQMFKVRCGRCRCVPGEPSRWSCRKSPRGLWGTGWGQLALAERRWLKPGAWWQRLLGALPR